MKTKLLRVLLTGLLLSLGATSIAKATGEGWYTEFSGGLSFTGDVKMKDAETTSGGLINSLKMTTKTGGVGHLSIGYFMDEWRFAGELGYMRSKLDELKTDVGSVSISDASLSHLTFMANVFYDIPLADAINWYIGGGLGFASVRFSDDTDGAFNGDKIGSSDTVFAYQGMTGFGFDIADDWMFTLGYRLMSHAGTKHKVENLEDVKFKSIVVHNVEAGFRYKF